MKELINQHIERHTAELEKSGKQALMLEGAIQALKLLLEEEAQKAEPKENVLEAVKREGKEL